MTSTAIELGALLDTWAADGAVGIVETVPAVTVSRLGAFHAAELLAANRRLGWQCELQDAAGEPADIGDLHDDFAPYVATFLKGASGTDCRLLTCAGFGQVLAENGGGVWQIACARMAFATGIASFSPWGGGDVFSPASPTKSPLDIVREASETRVVPTDIRKWLLRADVANDLWIDKAFQIFAAASAPALIRSLASEVVGEGGVVFTGPPRLNIALLNALLVKDLGIEGYRNLRSAVAWVYEDAVSAEQRHALFAAEFARSVLRDEPIGKAFRLAGRDILEGARLAFQLSQSNLSREAIKAQGDLRKAIADDTAKMADGTRTLSGAIAVAIATAIALVAARSTGTTAPWVLALVAAVVAGYLLVVALSGWAYLGLQRDLRDQWRRRFYRFIPDEDYKAMVTDPARSAERPYNLVAAMAIVVSLALFGMALVISGILVLPTTDAATIGTGKFSPGVEPLQVPSSGDARHPDD
jgi:hypothetical protein